jgi:hypothetical protein
MVYYSDGQCIAVAFRLKRVFWHLGKERDMGTFKHRQRKSSTDSTPATPTSHGLRSSRPFAPALVPTPEQVSPNQQTQPTHSTRLRYSLADIPIFPPERENRAGPPNNLKGGVESFSGLSLDDIQVHYNSSKPAQVQALAYAQGTTIHAAPGREKHLAHEAWHVVQQKQGDRLSEVIRQAAHEGLRTPSNTLPYFQQIKQAFGRHDISRIQAHLGPEATKSSEAMHALAYASGNHIVFSGTPNLRTVAHEAAHIVQQRGVVQLTEGIGKVGDIYEQSADAVADQVTAGRSVEHLLDECAETRNEMPGAALHSNREQLSALAPDFQPPVLTNLTQLAKRSDSAGPVQQTERQPVIQMQVKIELKEDISDLSGDLLHGITKYNQAVEAFHSKEGGFTENRLWEMLNAILGMAQELSQKLGPLSKKQDKLHKVTEEIRYAQAHIRPANPGLPMLTMLPWNQMETLGIASPFHSEHFENIFPEHQIKPPIEGGILGPEEMKRFMRDLGEGKSEKSHKYNYVVLTVPKGGDPRARQYETVYMLLFCKEDKALARGGHIDLAYKGLIAAGGEIQVRKGNIKYVDNSSGHYLPKGPSAKLAVINAFKEAGFGDISDKYVEKKWSQSQKAWVKEEGKSQSKK